MRYNQRIRYKCFGSMKTIKAKNHIKVSLQWAVIQKNKIQLFLAKSK